MDPRQPPQHPFSRNTASPYTPFQSSANQAPFPASSHAPSNPPSYTDHQRRPSDPPYYNHQRNYGPDGPPMAGPGHSRHQSASSVGHGTPVNRAMPPPSSPQQAGPQGSHAGYGPPPPRAPPVAVGPPSGFPSGRELPGLSSLGRAPNNGMSISSILGGAAASREQAPPQYASPVATSGPPNPMFGPTHASPRMNSSGPDYAPFRRPQTPEHQRSYEARDHRANSAGSPPAARHYGTPEARQFGTPYRGPAVEERREPIRVPNPNAIPPRPNSQPTSYNAPSQRAPEQSRAPMPNESIFGRRENTQSAEPSNRPEPGYGRQAGYGERLAQSYGYAERERQERDAAIQREREQNLRREQENRERAEQERQQHYAQQLAQRNAEAYNNRPQEQREQPAWMRPRYEESRPPYERTPERPPPQQPSNGYDYPASSGPQYGGHPAYAPNEQRYAPTSQPPTHTPQPTSQYEASIQERQRLAQQQQQQQQTQAMYSGPSQNGQYQAHESPARRSIDESQHMQQQRSFLGVQEINRKGRLSPLPQAVQGVQGQINPGGEPSVKTEFGRMFSGIGSGVGGMGAPSPVSGSQPGVPFSTTSQSRRDEMESQQGSPVENGAHKIPRTASRGGRRRKLRDEESTRDDDSSTGRGTPSGRGKRVKHLHFHPSSHHRSDPADNASSGTTMYKLHKAAANPSPPGAERGPSNLHHHHVPVSRGGHHHHHHHHHVTPAKPVVLANPIAARPKHIIRSKAVLDAVSHLKRRHLGQFFYKSSLSPSSRARTHQDPLEPGYTSTPAPLPKINDPLNCTLTVKISRNALSYESRREITGRKYLFGTDIYSDDSDVIAACIHQGWFRGAWNDDVDISYLGLELDAEPRMDEGDGFKKPMTEPPSKGPAEVPKDHDAHVEILFLPQLETYGSLTRFGIRSREWGGEHNGYKGKHDGISFQILSVKWVRGIDGDGERSARERKAVFSQSLDASEIEAEEGWERLLTNGNGIELPDGQFPESNERGGSPDLRKGMKGLGTRSWWNSSNGAGKSNDEATKELEDATTLPPDIEHREIQKEFVGASSQTEDSKTDIERVTERMIENANTADLDALARPSSSGTEGGDGAFATSEHAPKSGIQRTTPYSTEPAIKREPAPESSSTIGDQPDTEMPGATN